MSEQPTTCVTLPYWPRQQQREIHALLLKHRFGVVVCHRRMGKTVLSVNHLIRGALTCPNRRPRFGYLSPTYAQGKSTAFDFIQHYSNDVPGRKVNQSELRVDFPNEGQVRIYGADNPDSLRGLYFDGVVLDEFGLHQNKTYSEVVAPTLVDRGGWALFCGTPNGRNQFYDIAQHAQERVRAKDPNWFYAEYRASQTGLLDSSYLAQAQQVMTSDEYAQEFECSFEAAVKGAIYSKEMEAARQAGRITSVPYDPALPVETTWDLGIGDAMAVWFSQSTRGGEVRLIDYLEASGEGFPWYAQALASKGYVYGKHWAPHDINVRELSSGRSRLEVAASQGIRFELVPRLHNSTSGEVEEGIHALRMLFPRLWFDAEKCKHGIEALMHYRRDYNQKLNEFKATPVHDWASHGCLTGDAMVRMADGSEREIASVVTGDRVWTPSGVALVSWAGPVKQTADLVEVVCENGKRIRCTPEHKVLTQRGFVMADTLRYPDMVYSGEEWPCILNTLISTVIGSGFRATITGETAGVSQDRAASTEPYGRKPTGRFLKALRSTIRTVIPSITTFPTLRFYSSPSTNAGIPLSALPPDFSSLRLLAHSAWRQSGTAARPESNGTARTAGRHGRTGNGLTALVRSVASRFARLILRGPNTATRVVRLMRVESASASKEWVYDLTVSGHGCYQANGLLVSNSDAARYLACWHQTPTEKRKQKAAPMPMEWQWS